MKSGTVQNACSTRPRVDADLVKSALMRIARLMNSLAKGLKKIGDKSAVNYTTVGLRVSRYGAVVVFIDFADELKHTEAKSDVFNSPKPCYVMLTFETRIHRLE